MTFSRLSRLIILEVVVGAVIVTTTFVHFEPNTRKEYGYKDGKGECRKSGHISGHKLIEAFGQSNEGAFNQHTND
jgi:hypothetical protein